MRLPIPQYRKTERMASRSTSTNAQVQNLVAGIAIGASCSLILSWLLKAKQEGTGDKGSSSSASRSAGTSLDFASASGAASKTKVITISPELREEQLSRHTLYFGEDGIKSLQNAKICVVGLGGVGSHTAMMLGRGGAEYMRLIDFDQVTLSSLNRHACATLQDVGTPKVTCVQAFLGKLGLRPDTQVDARVAMYTAESGPALLELPNKDDQWDLVIDCIDDVPTKAALLAYCICHNIRVYSCMGAGGKSDMTRLHVSDLRTASRDPLASKLRQTLKRTMKKVLVKYPKEPLSESGDAAATAEAGKGLPADDYLDDMDQMTIIYSSEKTVAKLADLTEEQEATANKSEFGAVDGMRIRVLPVLGPLPAIMGQSLAALALCELGQKPIHQPVTGERLSRNVRNKLFQHLRRREGWLRDGKLVRGGGAASLSLSASLSAAAAQGGASSKTNSESESKAPGLYMGPLEIDHDDVEYLMGVWRNRCGVTGARLGTVLELVRWDYTKPATIDNLVVMSTHALEKFDKEGYGSIIPAIQERIEKRLQHCRDSNSELF